MNSYSKVLSFGLVGGILAAATLVILFILGVVDSDGFTDTLTKTLAVIGVGIVAALGVLAVVQLSTKK